MKKNNTAKLNCDNNYNTKSNHISTIEKKIGTTTYILTSECSPNATETLSQKLERILTRNVAHIKNL